MSKCSSAVPPWNCAPFVLSIVVWHCTRTLLLMLCSFCFLLNGLTDSITAAAFHLLLMIDTKKASMTLWPLSLSHTHTQQLQGKWTSMAPFAASYLAAITLGQPMFGSLLQPRFSFFSSNDPLHYCYILIIALASVTSVCYWLGDAALADLQSSLLWLLSFSSSSAPNNSSSRWVSK